MTGFDHSKRAPLLHDGWKYIDKRSLAECGADDWLILTAQRTQYLADRQADEILRMFKVQAADPGFGYTVNIYQHCLQTATRMLRDNLPEEDVVVGLFHDIGYTTCPAAHGEFAALLLRPYLSERNVWMLQHHEIFQQAHFGGHPGIDRDECQQWHDHPYFEWAKRFVAQYDQNTINYDEEILPVEEFEPMVRRLIGQSLATAPDTAKE